MRRLLVLSMAACFALLASHGTAAETWFAAYDRGVTAVRAKNYDAGAEALQHAIGEMPNESGAVRAGKQIITYVPHFWLGIARFNLGDVEGSLREWKTSEDQGVVQNTQYYAQLREWVARAQSQKQHNSEGAAAESRKAADTSMSRALSGQMDAMSAGADRSESYRSAQRKLQEALDTFNKAGNDVGAYRRAAQTAQQAHDLFAAAADDARKQKAARAAKPPTPSPAPREAVVTVPVEDHASTARPATQTTPTPATTTPVAATVAQQPAAKATPAKPLVDVNPAPPVESEAVVSARIALQEYRRHLFATGQPSHETVLEIARFEKQLVPNADPALIRRINAEVAKRERELTASKGAKPAATVAIATPNEPREKLESAYRAFAAGNFDGSEQTLDGVLQTTPSAKAYLLRGCSRYTRAMLSRRPDSLLASATADFRSALQLDRALRLDPTAFSPKLIAFFEQLRGARN